MIAFHTPLMASARSRLHKALAGAEWRPPVAAGGLRGFLALDGERITPSQPVAWLIEGHG